MFLTSKCHHACHYSSNLSRNVRHWGSVSLFNAKHAQVESCCLSFTSAISISALPAATFPPSRFSRPAKNIYIDSNNHILTHITVWNNFPWTTWGSLDSSCQASKKPQHLWDSMIFIFFFHASALYWTRSIPRKSCQGIDTTKDPASRSMNILYHFLFQNSCHVVCFLAAD